MILSTHIIEEAGMIEEIIILTTEKCGGRQP